MYTLSQAKEETQEFIIILKILEINHDLSLKTAQLAALSYCFYLSWESQTHQLNSLEFIINCGYKTHDLIFHWSLIFSLGLPHLLPSSTSFSAAI